MPRCGVTVRVVSETGVREFGNAWGPGKMFSMDLMDAEGSLTRATVFNAAVDKLLPLITVAQCYKIYPVQVKVANRKFCEYPHELT